MSRTSTTRNGREGTPRTKNSYKNVRHVRGMNKWDEISKTGKRWG